jgi:hypothetical protein
VLGDAALADGVAGSASVLGGVHELGPAAVVEGDGQHHAGVLRGVGNRLADRSLDVLRGARPRCVERAAHPLDAHVQPVQLVDAPEELAMQTEDVAHLATGADPVLGREPEDRQPADVAGDGDPDQGCQVLLALGVAVGAR